MTIIYMVCSITRVQSSGQSNEGEPTSEGLWLTSAVFNTLADPFQVKTTVVGRLAGDSQVLPTKGTVTATDKVVSFARPGLLEEYTVSMDGVRQDFVIMQRLAGTGELQV